MAEKDFMVLPQECFCLAGLSSLVQSLVVKLNLPEWSTYQVFELQLSRFLAFPQTLGQARKVCQEETPYLPHL
jgi:hypothetical protein